MYFSNIPWNAVMVQIVLNSNLQLHLGHPYHLQFHLGLGLPGPLEKLNGRILKSIVTVVAEDVTLMGWRMPRAHTIPQHAPENYKGSWSSIHFGR